MDMRSETGMLSSREPFTVNLQKSPIQQTQPSMQNMRLAFAPDGTAIYKQVSATSSPPPPFPGSGGGGNNPTGESGEGANVQPIASHGMNVGVGEPVKRKRGRPRKYGPDGTMALGLSPSSASQASGGLGSLTNSASAEGKKGRGRPLGSGKKQQMAALGSAGTGFTPHVITVKAGEDVSSKIMSFLQVGPRAVCILSANGAISNVTLRQASMSGGTVTYEGRFEILSLSGSFLFSESGGHRSRTGGLSVSLAGPDGRVLGGGVAGLLTAASPIQVVVGSFISDGKKELKKPAPLEPLPSGKLPPVGGMGGAGSPTSHGTMSESSGGAGSPANQSAGGCSNGNQQGISNMPWK